MAGRRSNCVRCGYIYALCSSGRKANNMVSPPGHHDASGASRSQYHITRKTRGAVDINVEFT